MIWKDETVVEFTELTSGIDSVLNIISHFNVSIISTLSSWRSASSCNTFSERNATTSQLWYSGYYKVHFYYELKSTSKFYPLVTVLCSGATYTHTKDYSLGLMTTLGFSEAYLPKDFSRGWVYPVPVLIIVVQIWDPLLIIVTLFWTCFSAFFSNMQLLIRDKKCLGSKSNPLWRPTNSIKTQFLAINCIRLHGIQLTFLAFLPNHNRRKVLNAMHSCLSPLSPIERLYTCSYSSSPQHIQFLPFYQISLIRKHPCHFLFKSTPHLGHGSVTKTLSSQCKGPGFNPWSRN